MNGDFDTSNNKMLEQVIPGGHRSYRDQDLAQFLDTDSDGRAELLVPYAMEAMACKVLRVGVGPDGCTNPIANRGVDNLNPAPNDCHFLSYCPATPTMTYNNRDPRGRPTVDAPFPVTFWRSPDNAAITQIVQMPDHKNDPSIYRMRGYRFNLQTTNGVLTGVTLIEMPLPESPLLFSPSKFFNADDLHADGMDDLVGSFGCAYPGVIGETGGATAQPACTPVTVEMLNFQSTNPNIDWMEGYDDDVPFSDRGESISITGEFPSRPLLARNKGAGDRPGIGIERRRVLRNLHSGVRAAFTRRTPDEGRQACATRNPLRHLLGT